MNNLEQARYNMVEQQIRTWNVLNMAVLDLLSVVKREEYVPPAHKALALMDIEIPLGHGVTMWQPKVEARTLQALSLKPTDRVLEIGTGCGYLTALIAQQAAHVTTVEIVPELLAFAEKNLKAHHIDNVTLVQGDAAKGWKGEYDVIVLAGSVPALPEAFKNSLKPEGRLFAIVGDAPVMRAKLITRLASGQFESTLVFETVVAPLQNAQQPNRFEF